MRIEKRLTNLLFGLSLTLLFIVLYSTISKFGLTDWLILIVIFLVGGIIGELLRLSNGKELVWDYLDARGRVLLFINLTILLTCGTLPIKEGMSLGPRLFIFLVGYFVVWIITFFFGSEKAKEKLLWPKL